MRLSVLISERVSTKFHNVIPQIIFVASNLRMSDSGRMDKNEAAKHVKKKDRSHITVLPGTNPEMFKCNVCEKVFRSKKGKCYHDSCVTGIKPYKCNICEQSFVKRSHFEYHERVHTGYKPFKCSLCEKAFPQKYKLNRHMNSHKHEKEFCCEKCGKRYSKKEDLNNHKTLHTGQRPHVCKMCGKSFGMLTNLNRHLRTHSKERPYTCELCRKSFKDSSLLIRHKKIHGKERPFSCAHCNRPFLSKSELARHLVIHTDVKPFSCNHCNTIFRRKDNLDRHMRHHHADNETERSPAEAEKDTSIEPVLSKPKLNKVKKSVKTVKTRKIVGNYEESMAAAAELARGNSQDQINSRMDSLGNITSIIRGPGEFSNAVPVINCPIIAPKLPAVVAAAVEPKTSSDPATRAKKKTCIYTEPIPLAEAVTINRRIEEKLYPQNSNVANKYYFFRKNSMTLGQQENPGTAATNSSIPLINSSPGCHNTDTTRYDCDQNKTCETSQDVDNLVPTIRINESSQHFQETISIHHWRRRTAELYRSSRSLAD